MTDAADYAQAGYPVFRCRPKEKTPLREGWQQEASRDPDRVRALWAECPDANVGLLTGTTSGLWVLDIDGPSGMNWFMGAAEDHGGLPMLPPTQLTGGGGLHFIFALPPGETVRNSVGTVAPKVDIRGEGGFAVLPPSIHPDGGLYTWLDGVSLLERRPPLAPDWLYAAVMSKGGHKPARSPSEWRNVIAKGADEGARNSTMASLVGYLLRDRLPLEIVLELALAWNEARCRPPLSDEEVEQTVESIARKELMRRGWQS